MAAEAGRAAQVGTDVAALVRDGALAGRWVLDPRASRVEFRVRHFWGAVTVRGWFERLEGEGGGGPGREGHRAAGHGRRVAEHQEQAA